MVCHTVILFWKQNYSVTMVILLSQAVTAQFVFFRPRLKTLLHLTLHPDVVLNSVSSDVCLLLSDLNRYDELVDGLAAGCSCRCGRLYGQHSVSGQRRTDVLQVHPLWQP